jgi:hypothetical protein
MTVMVRSLGIPARYVNGFLPGEFNDVGDDYIIRASDAHSWVEVFFPGHGWITFDPTPPSDERARGLFSELGLYWDWFQLQWNEWVVNYDFIHQFSLAQGVQRASRRWTTGIRETFESTRSAGVKRLRQFGGAAASTPLWIPVVLALLFIGTILLCNDHLRERFVFACKLKLGREPLPGQTASHFYERMLRLLQRGGWRKMPSQTPLEFATSLPPGEHASPVMQLTSLCMAARFGGQSIEACRFADLLSKVKASLRRR